MKRVLLLILILFLTISVLGCNRQDEILEPVNFYYCTDPVDYNTSTGVISPEQRDQSGYNDLQELMNLYLAGPNSDRFRSPFPIGVKIVSIDYQTTTTVVCVNDTYATLSGHELTLACVCLSKTVMDLTGCTAVRIQAESLPLDANAYIEMSGDDFLFLDEYIPETQP